MPQMYPLNWIILFIFFSLIFIFFNIINYFNFKIEKKNKMFIMKKNSQMLNWKW
uniref:ATP synthase complex subunit 8 n=1 Tax=Asiemphytus rufocephalus TaxID=1742410 RepID=A0A1I9K6V9_9HYME|nr:ATP synthase FO subunit 8 [Asiemphytus rufocephalus]